VTATAVGQRVRAISANPDRVTLVAFLVAVCFGGIGPVFIRMLLREVPPMWGGFVRFSGAAVLIAVLVAWRGIPLPRGRALVGTLLFGALGMGLSTILIYRGLVDTPAGVSQVILALVPLETFLLAVAVRIERFRLAGLAGAAIAVSGVGIVFGDQINANVPLGGMVSLLMAGISIAATTVVLKWFPSTHPLAGAAVALPIGALMFLTASLLLGEPRTFPYTSAGWLALFWLLFVGTLGVMTLFLFVISRMSASNASYQFLLMPLVTVAASAVIAGETISAAFALGAAVVLLGVYVGIIRSKRAPARAALSGTLPVPTIVE
jgi:drug/metabolite transporter (DMT)-like permease